MTNFYDKTNYEKFLKYSPDLLCAIDENGQFVKVSDSCEHILGYTASELEGKHYIDFVSPDDRDLTLQTAGKTLQGHPISDFKNTYRHAQGKLVPLRWSATWSQEDRLIFCIARPFSERQEYAFSDESSLLKYKALFDHHPDVVFYEGISGNVEEVNSAFRKVFGGANDNIIGKPASSFLPPNLARVNTMSHNQALLGSTLRFDMQLTVQGKEERVFDTEKFPVIVHGKAVGALTIAKDITPVVRSYKLLDRQAKELGAILDSISDAFFALDTNWHFTYLNSVFAEQEGYRKEMLIGKNIWAVFPLLTSTEFYRKCMEATQSGVAKHFEETYAFSGETFRYKLYPTSEGLSVFFTDITKKRKMQHELERLSLVASKTNSSVIIADRDWKIEWVNEGFTRLMGYSMGEAVGKRPSELLYSHKTDKSAYEALEERVLRGEPISFEVLNIKKSGEEVWVNVDITAIFGEDGEVSKFIEVLSDITALKQSEQELEKLSLVASHTDNSVVITDAHGRVEWVNEAFTKTTGYTLPEMVGKEPGAVLRGPETDQETVKLINENLQRGAPFSADLINYRKSGEKFWVSMDISPVYGSDGKIKRYIAIHRDITYQKEEEESLMKMAEALYIKNSNLQQFSYIVSHNLRAPIANALGLAHLLTKEKSSQSFDLTLSHLKTNLVRMDTVLRDVNSILSARERQSVLEIEQVGLLCMIRQTLSFLQEPLNRLGASVAIDAEETVSVCANRTYLFNVFYNLLTNAIRFRSHERPLVIWIRHWVDAEDGCKISFSDNGIGFNSEKAGGDIFRFYKRFHRNIGGRGIGLFLVKTYLEAMGGRIEVESQEDVGTRFTIYLP